MICYKNFINKFLLVSNKYLTTNFNITKIDLTLSSTHDPIYNIKILKANSYYTTINLNKTFNNLISKEKIKKNFVSKKNFSSDLKYIIIKFM